VHTPAKNGDLTLGARSILEGRAGAACSEHRQDEREPTDRGDPIRTIHPGLSHQPRCEHQAAGTKGPAVLAYNMKRLMEHWASAD